MGVAAIGDAFVAAEDMTGDGMDDLVIIPGSGPAIGQVFVARCTGSGFVAPEAWAAYRFILAGEIPAVADFNGDGRADLAAVAQPGTVWIAPSTGTGLGSASQWASSFSAAGEVVHTGDVNGDGRADLVSFTRGEAADVWVSLSGGTSLTGPFLMQDDFCRGTETPAVADMNGDGRDDLVSFRALGQLLPGSVHVSLSHPGNAFLPREFWPVLFAFGPEIPLTDDFNADGMADVAWVNPGTRVAHLMYSNGDGFRVPQEASREAGRTGQLVLSGRFNNDLNNDLLWTEAGAVEPFRNLFVALAGGHITPSATGAAAFKPGPGGLLYDARTPRKLVPVLVEYTDSIWGALPPETAGAWSARLFGSTFPSVNGMYREMSNGLFEWEPALTSGGGVFPPPGQPPLRYAENPDRANLFIKMKEAGFDFRPFDTNGDRVIDSKELIVMPIVNGTGVRNGQHVSFTSVLDYGGVSYTVSTGVAFVSSGVDFYTAVHELCHCLGAIDLYHSLNVLGTVGQANQRLTLMAESDRHVDPWHRMLFGWTQPRVLDVRIPYPGTVNLLPPSHFDASAAPPLLVHDSARHTADAKRFFLLDARSRDLASTLVHRIGDPVGGYDRDLPVSGLTFWYAETTATLGANMEQILSPGLNGITETALFNDDYNSGGYTMGGANRTLESTLLGGADDVQTGMWTIFASATPGVLASRLGYAPLLGYPGLYNQGNTPGPIVPRWRAPQDELPVAFRTALRSDDSIVVEWGGRDWMGDVSFAPWLTSFASLPVGHRPGQALQLNGSFGTAGEGLIALDGNVANVPVTWERGGSIATCRVPATLLSGTHSFAVISLYSGLVSNALAIPIVNPYADSLAMAGITGPAAAPEHDADSDGLGNLAEWMMGTDPASSASGPGRLTVSRNSGSITVTWPERLDRGLFATLVLQSSPDLSGWTDLAPTNSMVTPEGHIWIRSVPSAGAPPRLYFRLRARFSE